ncbi:MAG TPA: MFS transporter [Streptosporangiaceae bacterium]|jgi:MFS family permease|nr:MFS transporter [Streptosporangiaceae bacterium]
MAVGAQVSPGDVAPDGRGKHYKWIALSNTTLGILMVTINQSILLISLPDLFRGIKLNPLVPANTSYFLWVFMGFLLVTAVLVVSLGRVGDIYGRVRMYNLGFAIFTVFSILLSVTWLTGVPGVLWIIIMRVFQGVGGAFLFANSSAILTDAFPENERGKAMGINGVAAVAGSFMGLLLGGVLGPIEWRLVFLVSVPFGLFGTVWAYLKLQDNGVRIPAKIDWIGNATFAIGLIALLTGIVYSLLPYGGHPTGWTNPWVLAGVFGGIAVLVLFVFIELRVPAPMFRLSLFKIRAFTAGNIAALLGALGRGGMQFMLIIWLQGIWLPQHGYSFDRTPLWAGIYMVPLTLGFLIFGPLAGVLSDRWGARTLASVGLTVSGAAFLLLEVLPINFTYIWFALLIFLFAIGMGLFFSPNQAAVMNSLPPEQRGAGAGMLNTFQNSATVLSMGLFFTIVTIGLADRLPSHLYKGLVAAGVPHAAAHTVANEPPIGSLFSAFLGFNPIKELLGPTGALNHLSAQQAAYVTGRSFFPHLIEQPFAYGMHLAFTFAAGATVIAIFASLVRGKRYIHAAPALASAGLNGSSTNGASANGAEGHHGAELEAEAPVDALTGDMLGMPISTDGAGEPEAMEGNR